jgi:hypothetical protein
MMEINDELMTPGCPQCALKHICQALVAATNVHGMSMDTPMVVAMAANELCTSKFGLGRYAVARACVNLVEAMQGYGSHRDFAVGLLAEGERLALSSAAPDEVRMRAAQWIRCNRCDFLRLPVGSEGYCGDLRTLFDDVEPADLYVAHVSEAYRELPDMERLCGDFLKVTPSGLLQAADAVRKEYFNFEEAPAASDTNAEKGGETNMTKKVAKAAAKAATKAVAKKAPAKAATKAACKGGKCSGKKCK